MHINSNMTVLDRNPQNTNFLSPNRYQLSFSRVKSMIYFCQNVALPGISIGEVPRNTPFVDLYSPGEKLIYDTLNFTFLVDEDLKSWLHMHDWMRALTFPTDFAEYKNLPNLNKFSSKPQPQFSDASLMVLNSNFRLNYTIKFYDCFPVSLSSILFDSTQASDSIITADATFRFAYYDIEKA